MAKFYLKSAVVAAAIAFVWSMVSWMALPWHLDTMNGFEDEEGARAAFRSMATHGDGVYVIPNPSMATDEEAQAAHQRKLQEGPYIFINVAVGGMKGAMGPLMGIGFIANLLAAIAFTWLLSVTTGLSYWGKVVFVAIGATAGGFLALFPYYNWWSFPGDFIFLGILDITIAWFLGGLWLAKVSE